MPRAIALENRGKELASIAFGARRHLFGSSLYDHGSATVAALGAHIDQAIRYLYHIEIVLDNQNGVACIDKTLQDIEQLAYILEVQSGRRFILDVERFSCLTTMQLLGELDALRLAARERRRRLSQAHVPQTHIVERLKLALNLRNIAKKCQCL